MVLPLSVRTTPFLVLIPAECMPILAVLLATLVSPASQTSAQAEAHTSSLVTTVVQSLDVAHRQSGDHVATGTVEAQDDLVGLD